MTSACCRAKARRSGSADSVVTTMGGNADSAKIGSSQGRSSEPLTIATTRCDGQPGRRRRALASSARARIGPVALGPERPGTDQDDVGEAAGGVEDLAVG